MIASIYQIIIFIILQSQKETASDRWRSSRQAAILKLWSSKFFKVSEFCKGFSFRVLKREIFEIIFLFSPRKLLSSSIFIK